MGDTIRRFRKFGIYSLPAFLLAVAGVLLIAVLYYPAPHVNTADGSRTSEVAQDRQTRTRDWFDAMLADALRERQLEQPPRAQTLMYRYERDPFSAQRPTSPGAVFSHDGYEDDAAVSGSTRSRLIQL